MRPVLFRRWGLTIPSYTAMLYVGLVGGIVAGNAAAHKAGLNAFRVWVATCLLIFAALIGARLLYVVCHWRIYRHNPRLIWRRGENGLALYGGGMLAFPLSLPLLAAMQLSWGAFWDVAAFTILVGMVFTKIGCLLNGCCPGRRSNLWIAMNLPDGRGTWGKRIPSQLLELGWAVVLLSVAMAERSKLPFPGALFLCMTAAYAGGRLVLQSARERPLEAGRFGIQHGISLTTLVISLAALAAYWPAK
jgi:phosphatidylglycerol---prolipoprotein diacylglyceryl transferase